jgi:hypothetical protein
MNIAADCGHTRQWGWRFAGWINLAVGIMGLIIWALTQPLNPHIWWMLLLQALGPVFNFTFCGFCLGKGYSRSSL